MTTSELIVRLREMDPDGDKEVICGAPDDEVCWECQTGDVDLEWLARVKTKWGYEIVRANPDEPNAFQAVLI